MFQVIALACVLNAGSPDPALYVCKRIEFNTYPTRKRCDAVAARVEAGLQVKDPKADNYVVCVPGPGEAASNGGGVHFNFGIGEEKDGDE